VGTCPTPIVRWSMPHFSHCWTPSPLQAHWGRWHRSCLLQQACIFTVHVRECPVPPSSGAFHRTAPVTNFPAPRLLGGGCHWCLLPPACLFTVRVRQGPFPLSRAQGALPSVLCVFFFSCLFIIRFFFFPWAGSVCPRGYMICPWEYHMMLICSPGVSQAG
jgi:hypothetical protein